jgi:hypothetical protein
MGWNGPRSLASKCHKSVVGERHNCEEPSARHSATIGLDLAKPWFRQARGPSPSGVRPGDLRAPARSRDILYRGAPSVNGIISHTQAPRFFLTLAGLLPACVAGTENHPANIRKSISENTRFLLGVERISRRNRARSGKKPGRPWGDKGGRSGYQFRADWLGLDRRGTASRKARRHRTPWLDDTQCGARTLDPNVLLRREGPVNF